MGRGAGSLGVGYGKLVTSMARSLVEAGGRKLAAEAPEARRRRGGEGFPCTELPAFEDVRSSSQLCLRATA